jgi:hypothetical protein
MFGKTHRIRRTGVTFVLGLSVAAFAVPTALGSQSIQRRGTGDFTQVAPLVDGRSPDTLDAAYQARLGQLGTLVDGRSPDTLDAAYQAQIDSLGLVADGRSPDTVDFANQAVVGSLDGRSPDTLDAAYQAQVARLNPIADGRSPDTIDAGVLGRTQVVEVTSGSGFNWGDFGIGMAVAIGLLFILVGLGAGMREARHARHRLGSA